MKQGFMYLTAIIDLYSRYIVGWQISNSMEKETQTELLEAAIRQYGKPQIINSDQTILGTKPNNGKKSVSAFEIVCKTNIPKFTETNTLIAFVNKLFIYQ